MISDLKREFLCQERGKVLGETLPSRKVNLPVAFKSTASTVIDCVQNDAATCIPSKGHVLALAFNCTASDSARLNALVDKGYKIVASSVMTQANFKQSRAKYAFKEKDWKQPRHFKDLMLELKNENPSRTFDYIFLDYVWLQNTWMESGHYGSYFLDAGGHVEIALIDYNVKQFILPVDTKKFMLLHMLHKNVDRLRNCGITVQTILQADACNSLFFVESDFSIDFPQSKHDTCRSIIYLD